MSVQQHAADILQRVSQGQNLTVALDAAMQDRHLSVADRAALRDIAYGCQRYLATLNFWLRSLLPRPLPAPQVEQLLRVALYQLAYTRNAAYAVVDNAVREAEKLAQGRFKGLVNGVLRNFTRRSEELTQAAEQNELARINHPRWWLQRLQQDYPDDWQRIIDAGNTHPPLTLRLNRRRISPADYQQQLTEAGLAFRVLDDYALQVLKPVGVQLLPGFSDGQVSVQDWGAQRAALMLDVADGQRILDACAAPGGKACHILELADVQLTALDADETRLQRVRDNLARLGLSADCQAADAGQPGQWWDGRPYDRILADVPCTASGVVRRHPDIKWLRQPADAVRMAAQQAGLLDALWPTLAPGGKMLYATCSVFPEENRRQIDAFLQRHNDAALVGDEQLLPNDSHDGFYYALLARHR